MMNHKNFLARYIYPSALVLVAFLACACSEIGEDDRYIEVPPVEGDMVVLLEDFTGQRCTNCYEGHDIVAQLQEQYPGRVVAVSIHAGPFAVPVSNTSYVGLMQPFADDMARRYGIDEYPSGVINALGPYGRFDWAAKVREALAQPSYCSISTGRFGYDVQESVLTGTVMLEPGMDAKGRVAIWLVENDVVARQYNVPPEYDHKWDKDYVHNHVLRAYFGPDSRGVSVNLSRSAKAEVPFSFRIDPTWNVDRLQVVTFVIDEASGVYMQTAVADVDIE